MTTGERVAAGALATVGARFRAQGRDPALGLDCVGVVACALEAAGCAVALPTNYALRSGTLPAFVLPPGWTGADGARAGDVLLCRVAATQLHLAVRTHDGFVHADAALRRVVARPGAPPWPVVRAWRAGES